MKKNIYITPKIKVKHIDSEEILSDSINADTNNVQEADNEEEVNSKSNSMFSTDNDNLWE